MATIEDVARYYDGWTSRYLRLWGDILEARRPSDTMELLNYLTTRIGLKGGMHVLDAGCGVCGPALHFATHLDLRIEAVTVSSEQVRIAREKVAAAGLGAKVNVRLGDYHHLKDLFAEGAFDGVYFLESLGHSTRVGEVIRSAWSVLKDGGFLFVKDMFLKEADDPELAAAIARQAGRINDNYAYNVPDLHVVLSAMRKAGFEIRRLCDLGFESDNTYVEEFERQYDVQVYDGHTDLMPVEWLEILCRKPAQHPGAATAPTA